MSNVPLHPMIVHFPIVLSILLPIVALAAIWALRKKLLAAGVVVSCRGGGVRISAHGYNDEADVGRLLEVVGDGHPSASK